MCFQLFCIIPRGGVSELDDSSILNFSRNHHIVLHNSCTILHTHQQGTISPRLTYWLASNKQNRQKCGMSALRSDYKKACLGHPQGSEGSHAVSCPKERFTRQGPYVSSQQLISTCGLPTPSVCAWKRIAAPWSPEMSALVGTLTVRDPEADTPS